MKLSVYYFHVFNYLKIDYEKKHKQALAINATFRFKFYEVKKCKEEVICRYRTCK